MQSIGRQSMLELIDTLSPEQQQVLTLKFVFNFANADVATILDKTEGAIKSLQHRALASLQKQVAAKTPATARPWLSKSGSSGCRARASRCCSRRSPARARTARSAWRRSPIRGCSSSPRSCTRARSRRRRSASSRCAAPGPQLLGNLRQVDALLVVLDGFSGTRVPADDLETLKLELLVADRDHVERRLERVAKQAKSGDAKLQASEAEQLERLLAHLDAGNTLADWDGGAAARARAADDEAADLDRERAGRDRPEARGGARRAAGGGGGRVPRRRRVRARRGRAPARETLDLITFFTAGEKETRAWTLRRGQTAIDAAGDDPLRHRARLHPLRGRSAGTTSSPRARTPRRRAPASSGSRRRPTSSRTATC